MNRKDYTVVLRYPDYITDGEDQYFIGWAHAVDIKAAVHQAKTEAAGAENDGHVKHYELTTVAVFNGHHTDINK